MVGKDRLAVRVLLLGPDSRVLLFEGRDLSDASDAARWWFTTGGKVERGETLGQAAEREVREETGQTDLRIVGPFHRREFDFVNHGTPQHQIEHFFAARTGSFEVSVEGWTDLERKAVVSWRWWTVPELKASPGYFYPLNLVELVHQAAALA